MTKVPTPYLTDILNSISQIETYIAEINNDKQVFHIVTVCTELTKRAIDIAIIGLPPSPSTPDTLHQRRAGISLSQLIRPNSYHCSSTSLLNIIERLVIG